MKATAYYDTALQNNRHTKSNHKKHPNNLKCGGKRTHTSVLQSEVNNKPGQLILQNLAGVTRQQQLLSKRT